MISMETIRAMAALIAARFNPERVILFGSFARGQASEESDVDLLVEVHQDERAKGRGNPIHRALAEGFLVPTDVIIRTSSSVSKHRDNPYSVVYQALREGVVLYDKRA